MKARFVRADGRGYVETDLAVDTGDAQAARISSGNMRQLKLADGPTVETNFGRAYGGWVFIRVPELGLERYLLIFATDQLVIAVNRISRDFEG